MGKFVVFRLGEEEFGVDVKRVIEITKSHKPSTVPDIPDFVSGVMTFREDVVPLVDLRKRFNIVPAPSRERNILVRLGKEKVGLVVDEVKEILDFNQGELSEPPGIFRGFKRKYLAGLGKQRNRIVMILNLDNILTSEEKIKLEKSKKDIEG